MELARELDDEIDGDGPEDEYVPECELIIERIEKKTQNLINQIETYKKSKECEGCDNPILTYLNENIFIILLDILEKTLRQAIETNSLQYHKTPFNPMDFIAEQLWNLNPNHPERQDEWVNIFDTDWAKELLKRTPRPYFPFSWIWNKEYAVLKIQSYMRGYWVRRRDDVQEVRQFWKALQEDRTVEKELEDLRPQQCECNKEKTCEIHMI